MATSAPPHSGHGAAGAAGDRRARDDPADPEAPHVRRPALARADVLGDRDPDRRDRLHRRLPDRARRPPRAAPRTSPSGGPARPREGRAAAPVGTADTGERPGRGDQGRRDRRGLPHLALQQPAGPGCRSWSPPATVAGFDIDTVRGHRSAVSTALRGRTSTSTRTCPATGRWSPSSSSATRASPGCCCRSPSAPRRSSRRSTRCAGQRLTALVVSVLVAGLIGFLVASLITSRVKRLAVRGRRARRGTSRQPLVYTERAGRDRRPRPDARRDADRPRRDLRRALLRARPPLGDLRRRSTRR